MCRNIVEKAALDGLPLLLHNRTPQRAIDLKASLPDGKAEVVTDLAQGVAKADVIFTCVANDAVVQETLDAAIASGNIKGKLFIDCSTIDPATSLSIADAVQSASPNAHFYDAPVSGGVNGAAAATLTFMVGASPDESAHPHFHEHIKPLLKLMGANIFCLGGPSLGLVAKLSNNYLSGIIAIATSEAMNIGMRHGIDPKLLRECFKNSSGGNWVNGEF